MADDKVAKTADGAADTDTDATSQTRDPKELRAKETPAQKPGKGTADEEGDYTPKGEAEQLPAWDKKRQASDQEAANERKRRESMEKAVTERLSRLEELMAEVAETVKPKVRTIEEIQAEIDELKVDEYMDDEEKGAFKKKMKALAAELKASVVAAAKPKAQKKAEKDKDGDAPPQEPDPRGITQDEYYSILDAADKEYGAQHRRTAVKELSKFLKAQDNAPAKPVVEAQVIRVYAKLALAAATKPEAEASQPQRTPKRPEASDTTQDNARAAFGLTTKEYAEAARKRAGRA